MATPSTAEKIQGKASVVGEWTLAANSILVPYETNIREEGNFFNMISADYGITMEQMVDMFVDDANHIVGCEHDEFFPVQDDMSVTSDFDQEPCPSESHIPMHTTRAWKQ